MDKYPDLVDQLKMNIAMAFMMFDKLGIDKKAVLEKYSEIDDIMTASALEVNNGNPNVNAINIDVTISMLLLVQRLELVEKLYGKMADILGVSRDVIDDESRILALKMMNSAFKKSKN